MKKILLFLSGMLFFNGVFGQVIDSQNFNSLTPGNVGTNFTGGAPGQGGYYLINGSAPDYQITTIDAVHVNSLKMTAGPGYSAANDPNNHTVAKVVGVNASTGNDIIKATFSLYTGSANGAGSLYMNLLDDGATPNVMVSLIYNVASKTITAGGTLTNNGTRGFFGIKNLGTTPYPANTWVSVGMAYNMTTGVMNWYTPQESYTFSTPPSGYALITGLDVGQYRFYNINASTNTVAYNWAIDDFNLLYSNNNLLSTKENVVTGGKLEIYPNPVSDVLNFEAEGKIREAVIIDFSGKKVVNAEDKSIDVSDLNPGTYILKVSTDKGTSTSKFIKK